MQFEILVINYFGLQKKKNDFSELIRAYELFWGKFSMMVTGVVHSSGVGGRL